MIEPTIVEAFSVLPPQGLWTEAQYFDLALSSNRFVEFSDGIVDILPTPTSSHQSVLGELFTSFYQFVQANELGQVLFGAMPVQLWEGRICEPDLMFLSAQNHHLVENEHWIGADLVMEVVHPRNPNHDYVTKRAEYAQAGIREYWIVDPRQNQRKITVLVLEDEQYVEHGVFMDGETADSPLTNFTADVTAVFDDD